MRLRVEEILTSSGVEYRIIELRGRAISVNDVIEYSKEDINPDEICKTILVSSKGSFQAVFLRGKDKIDFKKLEKVMGKSSIASFEEVVEVTGFEPGAVCPLLVPVRIFVDAKVMKLKKVNFGSGNHFYGVEMKSSDLKKVVTFKIVDISS